jgi:hypothetical protein
MADRIFPNNTEVDMGSKISFSGIDWASVEHNMQNNKFASSQDEQIKNLLKMAEMTMDDSEGDNDPDDKEDYVSEETETEELNEDENIDGGKITEMLKESKSNTTMKKIAFTHPNQISAEAIESAKAAGDENLVKTILSARKANRKRIASIIEQNIAKETFLAERKAERENIIKVAQQVEVPASQLDSMSTEDLRQLVSSFNGNAPDYFKTALEKRESSPASMEALSFTSPTKFSKAQRDSFKKIAQSLGMPSEYVESMCAPVYSKEVEALAKEVKEIYSSNASGKIKASLITATIKEAKLSPDSKSEFIDYWNDVLGYQDKEFWPAVAADYDTSKEN